VVRKVSRYLPTKPRVILAALIGVGLGGGVALAASESGSDDVHVSNLGVSVSAERAGTVEHVHSSGGKQAVGTGQSSATDLEGIPAHMLEKDTPIPFGPGLAQVSNAWLVSDGKTLVAVYAGAAGNDPQNGRFVIIRQNWVSGQQTQDVVDVAKAGMLTISSAPMGTSVETSAQHGDIEFTDAAGDRGVLNLSGDTTTVRSS
jgi:hypothetical protein